MIRKSLELSLIRLDGRTYSRVGNEVDGVVICDYAHDLQKGDVFPPIDVFYDGEHHWLAHGWYRYWAAEAVPLGKIDALVHEGSLQDAVRFSAGVNADHGVRRTRADKRLAVSKLLDDPKGRTWSDYELAEAAKVSHWLVASMRAELTPSSGSDEEELRTYRNKHGQIATMRVGAIGGRQKAEEGSEASGDRKPHLRLVEAPRSPLAGHREKDDRSRTVSTWEAVDGILRACRTLPSPQQALSDLGGQIDYAEVLAAAQWLTELAMLKKRQIEKAG